MNPNNKWISLFQKDALKLDRENLLPLSYYGAFTRGIATGANFFFSLSSSKYKALGLPRSALKYCITKSTQIRSNILTTDDIQKMEKSNSNIFILDVNNKNYNNKIKKYILYGEKKRISFAIFNKQKESVV